MHTMGNVGDGRGLRNGGTLVMERWFRNGGVIPLYKLLYFFGEKWTLEVSSDMIGPLRLLFSSIGLPFL